MNMPLISVIIATYNRWSMLERNLYAFSNQRFTDFELIVASDGSSDGTDEKIASFKNQGRYLLHYIRQEDKGFRKTLALNKAIKIAKGRILVFVDDDTVAPPDFLGNYHQVFKRSANMDSLLVFAKYIPIEPDDPLFTLENIHNLRYMQRYTLSYKLHFLCWKWKYLTYFWRHNPKRPKLNGGNFAVSAAAIKAINGFDNDFNGWGYEDDDLRRRLLASGTAQAEAVCSAWNFNLGYTKTAKTTAQHPEFIQNVLVNRSRAYDLSRPDRCINGIDKCEEMELLF